MMEMGVVGAGHDGLTSAEADRRREEYGFNEIRDNSKQWNQLVGAGVW
jgi:hypothetical protein